MFKLLAILATPVAALCGCGPILTDPTPDVPALLTSGVTATYDAGGPDQYPATVWHYDVTVAEDTAGFDCDARGGSMIDDTAERFVCVTD